MLGYFNFFFFMEQMVTPNFFNTSPIFDADSKNHVQKLD